MLHMKSVTVSTTLDMKLVVSILLTTFSTEYMKFDREKVRARNKTSEIGNNMTSKERYIFLFN